MANGGTLFLDEVGELPLALQAKLLTFLDAGRFRRLGGSSEQTSTARIVAATNRDLEAAIGGGDVPRGPVVPALGLPDRRAAAARAPRGRPAAGRGHRRELSRAELGRRGVRLGARRTQRLQRYPFPGNVRELRNVLERAIVLEPGPTLELHLLDEPASTRRDRCGRGDVRGERVTPIPMEEVERRYARYVLERFGGRRMEAARALGLSYPTFLKRLED